VGFAGFVGVRLLASDRLPHGHGVTNSPEESAALAMQCGVRYQLLLGLFAVSLRLIKGRLRKIRSPFGGTRVYHAYLSVIMGKAASLTAIHTKP
jgi:hypothetical protein